MNALLRKKQEWEFQNERYFLKLIETSADVSVESVKRAGLLASFLVYLVYKISRGMLALANAVLRRPNLIRYIAPERPYELVEPTQHQLEYKIMNTPFLK